MPGKLEEYRRKRDFKKTPEPAGIEIGAHKEPIFVIQKHQASTLHYDLRLEIGGVLKSWAIPKGPTLDPSIKRLAVPTEDHPLDYADFEGVISEGEYGGGTVMVWDQGTFEYLSEKGESVNEAAEKGHITVQLHGKKLSGGFALIRTGMSGGQWLLKKMRDEFADQGFTLEKESRSALSGKTMQEIQREG
jgi:DNA ligase D-like protein (predicted 3'-phosphoesterase)